MSRYFFHLRQEGSTVLDEEGDDFATLEEARASAVTAVRELIAARIKTGNSVSDEYMDVTDEAGEVRLSLSFHDVVRSQLRK